MSSHKSLTESVPESKLPTKIVPLSFDIEYDTSMRFQCMTEALACLAG